MGKYKKTSCDTLNVKLIELKVENERLIKMKEVRNILIERLKTYSNDFVVNEITKEIIRINVEIEDLIKKNR